MKVGKAVKLPFKIIGWILLVVLVVFIGVNVYLCYVGFPPKVKDIIVEQMAKQLHRKVEIKRVGFCILKGFVVRDIKIYHKKRFYNKDKPFVEIKALVFKYDLSELMKKKIKIEKITLEYPTILIKRYLVKKKPVFNFSDLLPPVPKRLPKEEPEKKVEEKPKTPPPSMPKISKSQIPIDLQVEKIGLENANIEIEDTATPKFKEIYKLENVHFLVENIKIKDNAPISIKTGFGLSITEYAKGKKVKSAEESKTAKDINIEALVEGTLVLFDKKGILNPSGEFMLGLRNGKFTGIQAYEELRNQAKDINKSVTKYQESLLKSLDKIKDQAAKLEKAGKLGIKTGGITDKAGSVVDKLAKMDMSFMKGALEWKFLAETLEFDKIETKVKIKDGKIITDELAADGKGFRVGGGGYTAMDTTLAYNLDLLADKEYNKNQVTKALAREDGSLEFPVKISGTVSDMKIKFEKAEIIKKIMDSLKEQFMNQLKTRAGGVENLAKQMLNKYLGDYAKYADPDAAKKALAAAKAKAAADAKAKLAGETKAVQDAAAKKLAEEQQRLEAEKKKQEEAAKKKAEDEAKKKLKKLKF